MSINDTQKEKRENLLNAIREILEVASIVELDIIYRIVSRYVKR